MAGLAPVVLLRLRLLPVVVRRLGHLQNVEPPARERAAQPRGPFHLSTSTTIRNIACWQIKVLNIVRTTVDGWEVDFIRGIVAAAGIGYRAIITSRSTPHLNVDLL